MPLELCNAYHPNIIMILISNKNFRGKYITPSTCRIKSLLPAFGALNERDDEDDEQEAKNEEREEVALDKKNLPLHSSRYLFPFTFESLSTSFLSSKYNSMRGKRLLWDGNYAILPSNSPHFLHIILICFSCI